MHLLALAAFRGLTVRGPVIGRQHAFVLVRDWLGSPSPVDPDVALAELARRYLAGHAPAGDRDLAKWAGIGLRDARAGLSAIASELRTRPDGQLELSKRSLAAELPPPRLLGPFDPVLHGWSSREELLGPHKAIVTVNGLFRPFALVQGRAVGTWRLIAGKIVLEPFARLTRKVETALERDAEDVVRFLGVSRD